VRLLSILVTDIVTDKFLSPEEKKRAAEGLQYQLAGFLCIQERELPAIPGEEIFNIEQQILMKEILGCMPQHIKEEGSPIEKLIHIKEQLAVHAGR
jgi:hypothetical protein